VTVDSGGEELTVEVRGAFDDVEDISAVPTAFTPACDGHPLAPMAPVTMLYREPDPRAASSPFYAVILVASLTARSTYAARFRSGRCARYDT
jgi:hypothetical protein